MNASKTIPTLLFVTAVHEAFTGIALLVSPAPLILQLIGAVVDTSGGLLASRIAGAALLALGVACWLARNDGRSEAGRGLVIAMLLYDAAVVVLLVYADLGLNLPGIGLRPAAVLHTSFALWRVACLQGLRTRTS